MRIDRLDLAAFGPFTGTTLEFPGGKGLQVVYGPNEAGKSSALRAIGDLLFGIPGRTSDDFVHRYDQLRLRACISARDGRGLTFVRRKGHQGNDVIDDGGRILGRAALVPFLGAVDRPFFEHAFGLDSRRLELGALDLLASGGDMGRAILHATAGVRGLMAVLEELESSAAALFLPRGKTPAVSAALTRLKELEDEVRRARLDPATWTALQTEREKATAEIDRLLTERTRAATERERLQRIQRCFPLLARRSEVAAKLIGLAGIPDLLESFDRGVDEARREQARAEEAEKKLIARVGQLEGALAELPERSRLLDRADEIEDLYQQCGEMHGFRRDLPVRRGELGETTLRAATLGAEIAPALTLDDVLVAPVPRPTRKALRALAADARSLSSERERVENELAAARAHLAADETKLGDLGPVPDPAPLAQALRESAMGGDPVVRLSKAEAGSQRAWRSFEEAVASLAGWAPRSGEELASLPVPSDATLDLFRDRFAHLESDERDLTTERKRLAVELEGREAERVRLASAGPPPTHEAVRAARERRGRGWKLVRRVYVEGTEAAEEARLFDPDRSLADAFERSMELADDASDRLVSAADLAALDAELKRRVEEGRRRLAECDLAAGELAGRRASLTSEWQAEWKPANIDPRTAPEMKDWIRGRRIALDRLESYRDAEAERDAARDAVEREKVSFVRALAAVAADPVPDGASYSEIRGLVETKKEQLERALTDRKELERRIRDTADSLPKLDAAVRKAKERLEAWQKGWAGGVQALRRPASVFPEEVVAVLDACDEMDTVSSKLFGLRDRIGKMAAGLEAFEGSVARLCGEVAPGLAAGDAIEAAKILFDGLQEARGVETRRKGTQAELEQAQQALGVEVPHASAARAKIEALCREAGIAREEDLPARVAAISERRKAHGDLGQVEGALRAIGGGRSPEDLEAECRGVDSDAIPASLKLLEADIERHEHEIGELRKKQGELAQKLAAADGAEEAADKREVAAALRSRIAEDSRRWLRLVAAKTLLRRAVDEWRRDNQDPLLLEASKIFSALTRGAFESLIADVSEGGEACIVAERSAGGRVGIAGLSAGTRDQLFLALRLAALHGYAERAEPLPFVADDLLASFDDDRAAAALDVLASLAPDVQVILFTHHRHVVDLAKETLPEGSVWIQVLPGP